MVIGPPAVSPRHCSRLLSLSLVGMAAPSPMPAATGLVSAAEAAFCGGAEAAHVAAVAAPHIVSGALAFSIDGLLRLGAATSADPRDASPAAAAAAGAAAGGGAQPGDVVGLVDPVAVARLGVAVPPLDAGGIGATASPEGSSMPPPPPSIVPAAAVGVTIATTGTLPPTQLAARALADVAAAASMLSAAKAAVEAAGEAVPVRAAAQATVGLGLVVKAARAVGELGASGTTPGDVARKAEQLGDADYETPLRAIVGMVAGPPATMRTTSGGSASASACAGAGAGPAVAGRTATLTASTLSALTPVTGASTTAAVPAAALVALRLQLSGAAVVLVRVELAAKLMAGKAEEAARAWAAMAPLAADAVIAALGSVPQPLAAEWAWLHSALVDAASAVALAQSAMGTAASAATGAGTAVAATDTTVAATGTAVTAAPPVVLDPFVAVRAALSGLGLPPWLRAGPIGDVAASAASEAIGSPAQPLSDSHAAKVTDGAEVEARPTYAITMSVAGPIGGEPEGEVVRALRRRITDLERQHAAMATAIDAAAGVPCNAGGAGSAPAVARADASVAAAPGCAPLHQARYRLVLPLHDGGGPGPSAASAAAGLTSMHAHGALTGWVAATSRDALSRRLSALRALNADAAVVAV